MTLLGKKILLGVSGSIAAYKSAALVRLFVKSGAVVKVVMTESAKDFITPLTLSVLSKNPVHSSFTFNENDQWVNHVELALWADLILIAPATAKTLSKCAQGYCDDLLTAVYLSARCPVFFAPAMDDDMQKHPSTQTNIQTLSGFGNYLIESQHGELASGLTGIGRLAEPEEIVRIISDHFTANVLLKTKKILITAGPTAEAIDPVRFITNRSSGKMGYALVEAFAAAGAQVTLVSGPTNILASRPNIQTIHVESTEEMFHAASDNFDDCDLAIFAAAVADYRPTHVATQKIKKQGDDIHLDLTKTVDIAGTLGSRKKDQQLIIGFALETHDEMLHARQKLHAKNMDFIVLNSLNDHGAGFAFDTNKITVIDRQEKVQQFDLKSKEAVAQDILSLVIKEWSNA